MTPAKEAIIRMIQELPDDCSYEDIQYHLYVRQKIEEGLAAVDRGDVVSEEEADRRIDAWLDSLGPDPR